MVLCRYDEILEVGLPDWREPVFYYRKMRKMGLLELSCLLLVVVCVGQYLYGWAVYIEKQIVLVCVCLCVQLIMCVV